MLILIENWTGWHSAATAVSCVLSLLHFWANWSSFQCPIQLSFCHFK